ncbi:MAG: nitroreductase family protein [Firmicutes bacterium]|nr:nitroreductase family protein [Bacillota bacterium]
MNFNETLQTRRSVRKFQKGAEVPQEALEEMIRAAGAAPSGKNAQNWFFLVIRRRSLMEKIADLLKAENEAIAKEMEKKDPEAADRFRKVIFAFSLFFLDASALAMVYSTDYYPSGCDELRMIGGDEKFIDELWLRKNPGMQNVGAAMENFCLSAADQGFGTCWMTSLNYAAPKIEALIKEETGFDRPGWFLAACLSVGVPEGPGKNPAKKSLEEISLFID